MYNQFEKLNIILISGLISLSGSAFSKESAKDDFNEKIKAYGKNGEINEKNSMIAEVLVIRNEKKAFDQVNKLIRKYKGTALEPGLLFRKAELIVRQAKSARFFEYSKTSDNILSLVPPEMKKINSVKKLNEAINIYNDIEKRFPKYDDLDLVLFNNAFLRQQVGQKTTPKEIYYSIIKKFPKSDLIPDTYLSVAEMNYEQKMWKKALSDYEAIKNYPDSKIFTYALYKTAWTKFQLKDNAGAIKELENVIIESDKRQNLSQDTRYNLKEEALGDLVLFYSDNKNSKGAYAYFEKWAGKKLVGKYIIQLANIYESHGLHQDRANMLTELISNTPESAHVPYAYRDLINNDLLLKKDDNAFKHILAFEKHCEKYFSDENKKSGVVVDKKEEAFENEETTEFDAKPNCHFNLTKSSYKLAKKWHEEWKKKPTPELADHTDKSYRIYIENQTDYEKREKVRFSYAEFNFQWKHYKTAMEQYQIASQNLIDKKLIHDASYFAIISLEKYVGSKWTDENENKYVELANFYLSKNPEGKFVTDVRYKRAFINYEKKRYDLALPGFKEIGWKQSHTELGLKSQDLYLDILNIQKDYTTLMTATKELLEKTDNPKRKEDLTTLYRESYFAKAQKFQEDKKYDSALSLYEKFAIENKNSRLADQAWWNLIQIYIIQKDYKKAADKSMDLVKNFPNSKHCVEALKKAAEIYENLARPDLVGDALFELAQYEPADAKKWEKMSVDFYVIGLQFDKAKKLINKFLNQGSPEAIKYLLTKYDEYKNKIGFDQKTYDKLLQKSPVASLISKRNIQIAQTLFEKGNYNEAFKMSSRILASSKKDTPNNIFAEARYIQAQILEKELDNQSIKSKLDRLQTVLTVKTEKLDKAQRAYQEAIRFGDPEVSIKAFLGLQRCYSGYVNDLKNIKFSEALSKQDAQLITEEIQKMIFPLEDKMSDTLKEGLNYATSAKTFSGRIQELRNELNKVNLKLNKIVYYKPKPPEMNIVQ